MIVKKVGLNLQKSPNTRKQTWSCRLSPTSPFPGSHASPGYILGPPHCIFNLCWSFTPPLMFLSTVGSSCPKSLCPGTNQEPRVLPQGTADARSWAAQLHTSVKHPTAAKNSKHSSTKCRDAKGTSCPFFFFPHTKTDHWCLFRCAKDI